MVAFRLSRSPFRTYIHRTAEVDAIVASHGLVKVLHRTTLVWQLALYERPAPWHRQKKACALDELVEPRPVPWSGHRG